MIAAAAGTWADPMSVAHAALELFKGGGYILVGILVGGACLWQFLKNPPWGKK